MKNIKSIITLLVLLSTISFAQTNWKFDVSHTNVKFSVSHLVITDVEGSFKIFDGSVESVTDDDFTDAKINFSIDVNSINTENEKRDEHLRAADFFNTAEFPKITFVSKSMKKISENKYKLVGDFTMKGVTNEIELDVKYNGSAVAWGTTKAGFKLSGELDRFDYDLKWNKLLETGGAVVGRTIEINANVELDKK
ncbi:MAG: YceI family protein [Melioribacteraceae bacterium]|nr:YceI family protein [Melioribacteraceae bacterium]